MKNSKLLVISNIPEFYSWESDWITWLLSDFEIEHVLDTKLTDIRGPAVLVISGDIRGKGDQLAEYVHAHMKAGQRPIALHISDEWFAYPTDFYAEAEIIFRNHYHPSRVDGSHVRYLPLGYTNNLHRPDQPKPVGERPYLWNFVGEVKQRRVRMIQAARQLGPGCEHVTSKWADEEGLGRQAYSKSISDSTFVMCPSGNSTPDTFRLYEALELGAIPLVEDNGGPLAWKELASPAGVLRIQPWKENRWRSCVRKAISPSYWDAVYPDGVPFPRLCHWETLPAVVGRLSVDEMARDTQIWWERVKWTARREVADAVERVYGLKPKKSLNRR